MDAFEELPALLVVLIAISLFSVSFAHATMTWDDNKDFEMLQEDCQTFAGMVRSSDVLCGENPSGIYELARLQNLSSDMILEEFNSTLRGFEFRIIIQPVGNYSSIKFNSSEVSEALQIATTHSCVNLVVGGRMSAARLIVSIWEAPQ